MAKEKVRDLCIISNEKKHPAVKQWWCLGASVPFVVSYAPCLYFHAAFFCERSVLPPNCVKRRYPITCMLTLGFKSQLLLLLLLSGIICLLAASCWHLQVPWVYMSVYVCVCAHESTFMYMCAWVTYLSSLGWRGLRKSVQYLWLQVRDRGLAHDQSPRCWWARSEAAPALTPWTLRSSLQTLLPGPHLCLSEVPTKNFELNLTCLKIWSPATGQ